MCFLVVINGLSAQPTPTGFGLREVNTDVIVGTTLQTGMPDTQSVLIENSNLQKIFLREFNLGQVTCYPAWETWKAKNTYDFSAFNTTINWLISKDRLVDAQIMVGPDTYLPDWFKTETFGKNELDSLMADYIKSSIISNENNTKVKYWNMVNEPIDSTTEATFEWFSLCSGNGRWFGSSTFIQLLLNTKLDFENRNELFLFI